MNTDKKLFNAGDIVTRLDKNGWQCGAIRKVLATYEFHDTDTQLLHLSGDTECEYQPSTGWVIYHPSQDWKPG